MKQLGLILLGGVLGSSQALSAQYELSYFTALRGAYIFPANEGAPPSNLGLLAGRGFGSAGKAHGVRPFGLEATASWSLESDLFLHTGLRWSQTEFRLEEAKPSQKSQDTMLSTGLRFFKEYLGAEVGFRLRRFDVNGGPIPDSGQAGLYVLALYEHGSWGFLTEASLMALGLGLNEAWGVQRDSSSLRVRGEKSFRAAAELDLAPFVEFAHLHRSFYASKIKSEAIFVDDASLKVGITVRWLWTF